MENNNLPVFVTLVAQDRAGEARSILNTELSERILGALSDQKQALASTLFTGELNEESNEEVELDEATVKQRDEKNGVEYTHHGRGTKGPFLTTSKKIKKPLKEEEQLDEVSKGTLKRYIQGAAASMSIHGYKAAENPSSKTVPGTKKLKYSNDADFEKIAKRTTGIAKALKRLEESDQLDEGVSRKHFVQVAAVIKAHPDQEKRNELAKHHAEIFSMQNPRFDHKRFYDAAGANHHLHEEKKNVNVYTTKGKFDYKKFSKDRKKNPAKFIAGLEDKKKKK